MVVQGQMPTWAQDLVVTVCKEHKRALPPKVSWYNGSRKHSSGHTKYPERSYSWKTRKWSRKGGQVHVSAGTSIEDQRLVLLHELAHWLMVRNKRESHSQRFWDKAFELYEKYGVDKQYAYDREKNYKEKAKVAYTKRHGNDSL